MNLIRRALCRYIFCAVAVFNFLGACWQALADARPNVVLFVADDLGYGELNCQGNPEIPTPHIDSIARNGVRFSQGYVSSPYCSPSRAGMLTGRYQTRFGHELNVTGARNLDPRIGLPLSEKTLPDHLKAAGYATALIGKWHLGGTEPFHPQRRGFDEFYGFLHEGHTFAPPWYPGLISHLRTNEPPYDAENPVLRGTNAITEPVYFTKAITREAISFIERQGEKPFFLYVPYSAVHSPMQATPLYFDRFAHIENVHRRVFAAMLSAMDDSVGTILGKLREQGLEENTLVFFISDNGGPTAELTSSNRPLRGGKGQLWEGGIRVPFLMQWKGRIPAGRIYEHPVIALDIVPTALAAAGVPGLEKIYWDGVNLLPFLKGEVSGAPHETLFWRYGSNLALRHGNWKLVRQQERKAKPVDFQLFDLAVDPEERNNLAAQKPELLKELMSRAEEISSRMATPLW